MLEVERLESGYGPMQVLWGPSLKVAKGTITAVLGPNGAGKSTLLGTIFGSVTVTGGSVLYDGADVTRVPSHKKVDLGLTLAPEGKHLFPSMSVRENLAMGAYSRAAGRHLAASLELVYDLFPVLKERDTLPAGSLSGGQQQMVTIARALMTRPKLLMLDEPSQGLAPKLVGEVFETVARLKKEVGLTILLVEQNATVSLAAADYVYILHEGRIKAAGDAREIEGSPEIREAYLGI